MKVKEIMNQDYQGIAPSILVKDALKYIANTKEHFLIILEDNKPLGVLNNNDLIKKLAQGVTGETKINKIMRTDILTVNEDDDLEVAVDILGYMQVKQLVVTDKNNNYRGLLSIYDLATNLLTEKYALDVMLENSYLYKTNIAKSFQKIQTFVTIL